MKRMNKTNKWRLLVPLIVLALMLILVTPAFAQDGAIQWYKDLPQASASARKSDKPMMIEFWADWCTPCKVMETEVYADPRVATALRDKIIAVRIHFDLQKDLVRQYNVEAIPNIVFTDSWGTELVRHRGIIEADDLAAVEHRHAELLGEQHLGNRLPSL